MPYDTFMHLLEGARVLVLAIDCFRATELDLLIDEAGGVTVALVNSVQDALTLLGREQVDAAVLDLAQFSEPTAVNVLREQNIPFAVDAGSDRETVERLAEAIIQARADLK